MHKKYRIREDLFIDVDGQRLYRIQAVRDFGYIKEDTLGGFISGEHNLSHAGTCWVYHDAKVFDNGQLHDDAKIFDRAEVHNGAQMFNNSRMDGDSKMYDFSELHDDACMSGAASLYHNAKMWNNSTITNNAQMQHSSEMYDDAEMWDNSVMFNQSKMYDNSEMHNNAMLAEFAELHHNEHIQHGKLTVSPSENGVMIKKHLIYYLACALNIQAIKNNIFILYKRVNSTGTPGVYKSVYDRSFEYKDNTWSEVPDCNERWDMSCADGIHLSTPDYWHNGDTIIMCSFYLDDIITCQEGKVRVRRAYVNGIPPDDTEDDDILTIERWNRDKEKVRQAMIAADKFGCSNNKSTSSVTQLHPTNKSKYDLYVKCMKVNDKGDS